MLLAAFFPSCCCYEFWLPFPPAAAEAFAAAAAAAGPRMGKHHGKNHLPGSENTMPLQDGEAPKLHLENA